MNIKLYKEANTKYVLSSATSAFLMNFCGTCPV